MRTTIIATFLTLASLSVADYAIAESQVEVVNENKKELKVKIKAEGDNFNEKLEAYVKKISGERESTFVVTSADLAGKSYYSIEGDTNPFTAGDKCKHLSVSKDYRVTFLNDTVGTTCVAQEIK